MIRVWPPTHTNNTHTAGPAILVASAEKGLIAVSSMIEAGRLGEIGLVVIDEVRATRGDSARIHRERKRRQ